jgi:hypothetical protein
VIGTVFAALEELWLSFAVKLGEAEPAELGVHLNVQLAGFVPEQVKLDPVGPFAIVTLTVSPVSASFPVTATVTSLFTTPDALAGAEIVGV